MYPPTSSCLSVTVPAPRGGLNDYTAHFTITLSCAQALLCRGDVAHRLARVLRGAAAVTACRRHDAHTHQSTTMRCSVQRSDRATVGRRSRRVCPTARRPGCRPVPRAPWRVETGHTVRSIGVVHVPSASLGGAPPPSKTARRPPMRMPCSATPAVPCTDASGLEPFGICFR